MQYRKFGKLDWKGSVLGFGAMRLPQNSQKPSDVNESEAIRMIRYAVDHGVNYVDTAYPYHEGQSERVVGRALKDGYREKVKLATKLPPWEVESAADFDRIFNKQLERLQTNIDFYLLHALNSRSWPKIRDLGVLDWAERMMADGRISHLGFSFHDEFDVFKEIVDAYDNWTFCQIQYNYMDTEYQAGRRGLEYAAGRGLAVVVMEPLRGGHLTKKPAGQVTRVWAEATPKRSQAEWGLLWVWNHPEVSLALSGMSTMEHVVENVAVADKARAGMLTAEELALLKRVRQAYEGLSPVPCTDCGYCMPCENGVEIPRIFQIYNEAKIYGDPQRGRMFYNGLQKEQRADQCTECRECTEACPQGIDIPEWLKKAHALLKSE
jgi:predicted aldo/keto reductase-like oxidoreductase